MLVFCFLCTNAFSQSFNVEVSKKKISLGEFIELKYIFEGGRERNFNQGNLSLFQIKSGPNSSSFSSYSNGKLTQRKTISYVMTPKKAGEIKIPAATVYIKGKKFTSKPIKITVSKDAAYEEREEKRKEEQKSIEDFLYLKIETKKDTVYEGEQILVEYNLYTAYQVRNFQIVEKPTFPGFWLNDLIDNKYVQKTKMIDGTSYNVVTLKKMVMFPQVTGNLTLPAIEVQGDVRVIESAQGNNNGKFDNPFFSSPFSRYRNVFKKVKAEARDLVVLPLPETTEANNFTGAVGKFTIGANLSPRTTKTDEAVKLRITINGTGNLKLFGEPKIELPEELELYDANVEENIYDNSGVVRGSKVFEYPIIPRKPGRYLIPAITWSYFDIDKEKYENYKIGPYSLIVTPGDDYADNQSTFDEGKFEMRAVRDGTLNEIGKTKNWITSPLGSGLAIAPLMLMSALFFVRRQKELNKPDELTSKKIGASKVAIAKLKKAENFLKQDAEKEFYNEVIQAIWGYMNDKFQMPNIEMNKENIFNTLLENKVKNETATKIKSLIEKCEIALFAPSAVGLNKQEMYDIALQELSNIENQLAA